MDALRSRHRRVIVTRPAREAGDWVRRLQQAGFEAEALPLIEIAPVADAGPLQRAWQQLGDYAACMFVSGNAVDGFFPPNFKQHPPSGRPADGVVAPPLGANPLIASLPPGLRFLAPGPGTEAALQAVGLDRSRIDAPPPDAKQFDSEALWAVVGARDWQGQRVLIVRGQSAGAADADSPQPGQGRDWIGRQWLAAGAKVELVAVYQRCAPQWSPAQMARAVDAASDGSVWLFSSSEAVAHLVDALPDQALLVPHGQGSWAIATHPRIAESLRAVGWARVLESRPALADIQAALQSIESFPS